MDAYYDAAPIICKEKENSLSITAEGLALSCCSAGRMYKWWHKDPKSRTDMGLHTKESKLNAQVRFG